MKVWPAAPPGLLAAVTILADGFSGHAEVSTKLPARSRPERFVKVTRVGGGSPDPTVDEVRLLVECYASTTAQAEAMTSTARAALRNAVGTFVEGMWIRWCGNEAGLADNAHPEILDRERWQFTIDLWIKTNTHLI